MANLTISMPAADKAAISAFCDATGFTITHSRKKWRVVDEG